MNTYGDYRFEFCDVWHIQETNELEFTYDVEDSSGDFICEIVAFANQNGEVRFAPLNIAVEDVKYGDLSDFVNFIGQNLTHARMLADIGLKMQPPINDDGIIDPPSAAA